MRLVRNNHSIYWLALVFAMTAWIAYSPRVALVFAVAAVCTTITGFAIRYRPREGAAVRKSRQIVAPLVALGLALAVLVRALA